VSIPSPTPTPNQEAIVILRIRQPWFLAIALTLALAAGTSCNSGYKGNSTGYPTSPGPGTPKELNSGDFGAGAHYEHVFATAGTYPYHCLHHGPMTGTVEVNANATETLVNVSIVSFTSPFPAASVKPGGRVVWTNNTLMVHTVTSN
jgi:plastocyanin